MFCSVKIAMIWLFLAASWSSVKFTLHCKTRTDVLGMWMYHSDQNDYRVYLPNEVKITGYRGFPVVQFWN